MDRSTRTPSLPPTAWHHWSVAFSAAWLIAIHCTSGERVADSRSMRMVSSANGQPV